MEFQSYNAELGIANMLFKRIFDNIRIERTNSAGEKSLLKVTCVFGLRSRILKNLENPEKRGNMKVPMITINRTGYSRNGDRLNNLHNEIKYEMTSSYRNKQLMTPVPIDINYDVSIIAKYPEDLDKIASNFMIFFNSDIYVSTVHPKFAGIKMNNLIIMQDSVNEDHPDEIDGSLNDLITASFAFTYKTFLFGGMKQALLIHPKTLSTWTLTVTSTYVSVLSPNLIDEYLKQYPTSSVSAELTCLTVALLTTYVDNVSADVYEDMPIINALDFGFYAIPKNEDFVSYMQSVDNEQLTKHEHIPLSAEISDDYYDVVDNRCTLAPYVDRIWWKVDATIISAFPNNVRWYNDFDK